MTKRRAAAARAPSEEAGEEEDGLQIVFVRLPRRLLARIDRFLEKERKRTGYTLSRSSVLRSLLERAIDAAEK
jgi:metal-responsive CopG/Arc/MetJ family transcriptional regulator